VWLTKEEVAEGVITDLAFGCMKDVVCHMSFEEARVSICDLKATGFIDFSDDEGNMEEQCWTNIPVDHIWFRLTPKFMALLVATDVQSIVVVSH